MEWDVEKAKKLGIETFVKATYQGKPLYEHCGMNAMYVDHLRMPPRMPAMCEGRWRGSCFRCLAIEEDNWPLHNCCDKP